MRRSEKFSREIVRIVSPLLLNEISDPRLGFITVTRANVSPDLRNATVFLTIYGNGQARKLTIKAIKSARGFIQRSFAHKLGTKIIPELTFEVDRSWEREQALNKALNTVGKELKETEPKKEENTHEE